jgi:predicted O-methyltransferase YrrM
LVTQCLYDKSIPKGFRQWKNYRKRLQKNNEIIEVTDFGAGSRIFQSNRRKVSQIAKHAGISAKRAKLLIKLMCYFNYDQILEVGTSLGLATAALSLGNPKATIVTLEGCPETANIAKKMLSNFKFHNIEVVIGNFKETLSEALKKKTYDCIYFDGNHSKEATINYFEQCLPYVHNETLFIFDDIHWSSEMEEAWQYIQDHPQVTVSIDTFQWGLVFFRKEQRKEHFIIRV